MFGRPVDTLYPIETAYGEKDRRYEWSIDPDNGLWIPARDPDGCGQHRGIDFSCPSGTLVRAMADGIVTRVRFESALDRQFGAGLFIEQLVILPSYDSWTLRYCHLKAVHVELGRSILRYHAIAEAGDTGNTDHPMLHVELVDRRGQWREIQMES